MSDLELVLRRIDDLTPEEKQQVVDYIQGHQEEAQVEKPKPRVFDLHAGLISMSEDFDEELPDEFWLGEE